MRYDVEFSLSFSSVGSPLPPHFFWVNIPVVLSYTYLPRADGYRIGGPSPFFLSFSFLTKKKDTQSLLTVHRCTALETIDYIYILYRDPALVLWAPFFFGYLSGLLFALSLSSFLFFLSGKICYFIGVCIALNQGPFFLLLLSSLVYVCYCLRVTSRVICNFPVPEPIQQSCSLEGLSLLKSSSSMDYALCWPHSEICNVCTHSLYDGGSREIQYTAEFNMRSCKVKKQSLCLPIFYH